MKQIIHSLRQKPDHHKRMVGLGVATVVTAAVVFVWVTAAQPFGFLNAATRNAQNTNTSSSIVAVQVNRNDNSIEETIQRNSQQGVVVVRNDSVQDADKQQNPVEQQVKVNNGSTQLWASVIQVWNEWFGDSDNNTVENNK